MFGRSLCLPEDVTGGGRSVRPAAETTVAWDTRPRSCGPTCGSSETRAHWLLTRTAGERGTRGWARPQTQPGREVAPVS